MEKIPYHHLPDGTSETWRLDQRILIFHTLNLQRKKEDRFTVPDDHMIKIVRENLEKFKNNNIGWIGHATFLIKLGKQL